MPATQGTGRLAPRPAGGALPRSESVAGPGSHDRKEGSKVLLLREALAVQPETKPGRTAGCSLKLSSYESTPIGTHI